MGGLASFEGSDGDELTRIELEVKAGPAGKLIGQVFGFGKALISVVQRFDHDLGQLPIVVHIGMTGGRKGTLEVCEKPFSFPKPSLIRQI